MSNNALVIGIGNSFRRDDGVGLAVAEEVARRGLPGVRVVTAIGEPSAIIEAWSGARLAVVVDAACGEGLYPGRIRRWTPGDEGEPAVVSSHALGLPQTYALGQALGQIPENLVVFTVDIADISHGVTLTPAVAAAIPGAVEAVVAELVRPGRASNCPCLGDQWPFERDESTIASKSPTRGGDHDNAGTRDSRYP